MALIPLVVVGGLASAAIGLGWLYFSRWEIVRPPVGVFGLVDVMLVLTCVVAIPLLYLSLPTWALVGLLALGAVSALSLAIEPVLASATLRWIVIVLAIAGEILASCTDRSAWAGAAFVNDAIIICGVVGVSNLWVQSGLKARDAAILAGALTVYDGIATAWLPLMFNLFERVAPLPFSPIVGWGGPDGSWVGIGLGDLVVATVYPLVMRKAYGRSAGLPALLASPLLIAAVLALGAVLKVSIFPVMVVLGPAIVLHYWWWARRRGPERTMVRYALDERPAWARAQAEQHG